MYTKGGFSAQRKSFMCREGRLPHQWKGFICTEGGLSVRGKVSYIQKECSLFRGIVLNVYRRTVLCSVESFTRVQRKGLYVFLFRGCCTWVQKECSCSEESFTYMFTEIGFSVHWKGFFFGTDTLLWKSPFISKSFLEVEFNIFRVGSQSNERYQ